MPPGTFWRATILLGFFGWVWQPVHLCADEWGVYQHDAQHTGRSTASFDPRSLEFAWSAPPGYAVPLIVGERVYAMKSRFGAPEPTEITSFALDTGEVDWSVSGDYYFPSAPAIGNGMIVYGATDRTTLDDYLYVRNLSNGAQRYAMPLDGASDSLIAFGPAIGGNPVVYVASHREVTAVRLSTTGGSVLWSEDGSFGGSSVPTIVGNSVILAGPGQYYAFDRTSGATNHFHQGNVSGGGGTAAAYDTSNKNIYILEDYSTTVRALTAYRYTSNSNISRLWQRTDLSYGIGAHSVAIGSDGKIYLADHDELLELNPANGATVRSLPGQDFANGVTPMLHDGYLWAFSDEQTLAYDLATFTLARAFPGSRGDLNSSFNAAGALSDRHFVLSYGFVGDEPGFDVYRSPPPPDPGDANRDGTVDRRDLAMLVHGFGKTAGALWSDGDFTADGRVGLADLRLWQNHLSGSAGSALQVPEGGSLVPCTIAVLALWLRRSGVISGRRRER